MRAKKKGRFLVAASLIIGLAFSGSTTLIGCDKKEAATAEPTEEKAGQAIEAPGTPPRPTAVTRSSPQPDPAGQKRALARRVAAGAENRGGERSRHRRLRFARSPRSAMRPRAKDAVEKRILGVLEDMRANQSVGMMNVPRRDGRLLRLLAEAIGAKRVVEIGTSNGYSGLWIALALQRTGGRLTTLEINKRRASLARKNFRRAGLSSRITLLLGDAQKTLDQVVKKKRPLIDMVFLDADKSGYVAYLKKLLPLVRPGGLIVAHNTAMRRAAIRDYLRKVSRDPDLETLLFHMDGAGVGVTMKKR
jgi:predicted O-methyltransferase YrrM